MSINDMFREMEQTAIDQQRRADEWGEARNSYGDDGLGGDVGGAVGGATDSKNRAVNRNMNAPLMPVDDMSMVIASQDPAVIGANIDNLYGERGDARTEYGGRTDTAGPYGTVTNENKPVWDPISGSYVNQWSQDTTLNRDQQAILDLNENRMVGRGLMGMQADSNLMSSLAAPASTEGMQAHATGKNAPNRHTVQGTDLQRGSIGDPGELNPADFSPRGTVASNTTGTVAPNKKFGDAQKNAPSARSNVAPNRSTVGVSAGSTPWQSSNRAPVSNFAAQPGQGMGAQPRAATARAYNPMQQHVQQSLDFGSAPGLNSGRDMAMEAGNAVWDQSRSRLDPMFAQKRSDMEAKLASQGLVPGGEAYDRAMANLNRQETDAYQTAQRDAVMTRGQEADRIFGRSLSARQQAVGETERAGAFANQAVAQMFGQNLQAGDQGFQQGMDVGRFGQANRQQLLSEQMAGFDASATERGQRFNEGMAGADLANRTRQAQSAENLAMGDFANQRQAQEFGQNVASQQFYNQAIDQDYQRRQQTAEFENATRQQQLAEQMGLATMDFSQEMQRAGLQDTQRAAQFGEQRTALNDNFDRSLAAAQYMDQARASDIKEQMALGAHNQQQELTSATYDNQLRQQQFAEMMQLRNQSLAESQAFSPLNVFSGLGGGGAPTASGTSFGGSGGSVGMAANAAEQRRIAEQAADDARDDARSSGMASLFGTGLGALVGGPFGAMMGGSIGNAFGGLF
jgi:hypothetical protein